MTKLKFVGGSPVEPKELGRRCPCGWRDQVASRGKHAHEHLSWAMGVPVPVSLPWPEEQPIAVIHTTSPTPWRQLAYRCARIAKREGGYDSLSFPEPIGRAYEDEENTRAFCYRVNRAVVGYLSLWDQITRGRYGFVEGEVPPGDGRSRPTLLVWTAFHWRGLGIGRALVEAAGEYTGVGVAGLAWSWPFTDAGIKLARSCAGPDGQVWVA
jgi:hypothetical protein